jgi:hypothetical protein
MRKEDSVGEERVSSRCDHEPVPRCVRVLCLSDTTAQQYPTSKISESPVYNSIQIELCTASASSRTHSQEKIHFTPHSDRLSPTARISLSSPSLVAATYRNYSHHNRIIPDVILCNNPKLKRVSGTIPLPSRHKTTNQ